MRSVAIVAMGASNQQWFRRCYRGGSPEFFQKTVMDNFGHALRGYQIAPEEENMLRAIAQKAGERKLLQEIGPPFDEVWAINHMGKMLKDIDLIIAMDDLRHEKERYEGMMNGEIPILTSTVYPEFNCIEYPLREVINELHPGNVSYLGTYFRNTVSFAVAYAIYKGFDRISLYGCDFYYDGGVKTEEARANCEFWLGFAHARGIKIEVSEGSTTLDMNKPQKLYGYAEQPQIPFNETQDLIWTGKGWEIVPAQTAAKPGKKKNGREKAGKVAEKDVRPLKAAE